MKSIFDLLRRPAPTAADLRKALDELPPDNRADAVAALEAERRTMLLDGRDGRDLDKIDARITEAGRERDRTVALREELSIRLAATEREEAFEALAAERDAVETEARAVEDVFARRYRAVVDELLAMVARLGASEGAVHALNERLTAAGFTDRVAMPDRDLTTEPTLMYARRFALGVRFERNDR